MKLVRKSKITLRVFKNKNDLGLREPFNFFLYFCDQLSTDINVFKIFTQLKYMNKKIKQLKQKHTGL